MQDGQIKDAQAVMIPTYLNFWVPDNIRELFMSVCM